MQSKLHYMQIHSNSWCLRKLSHINDSLEEVEAHLEVESPSVDDVPGSTAGLLPVLSGAVTASVHTLPGTRAHVIAERVYFQYQ